MKPDPKLLKRLRTALAQVADPKRAPQMQAYMKSQMPFHGVPSPLFKKVCKVVFADIELPDSESWKENVLDLWRNAKFREERYGALFLAGHTRARAFQNMDAMNTYEEIMVTGAWWDYVDNIASHRVGSILACHPKPMQRLMLGWSKSSDIWKRRTSILCQLGAKEKTDLDFLYQCIEPSLNSNEFFLRKAIGWALRQVAWRDPKEIIRYVKKNRELLSPLSKREALKNVIKMGRIRVIP
ncbi:MAG: DNA alkylation repair protein [Proteobacteria bacterium]|nr:DNA alkylation repair protein [Pseudomonadota bacterium]NDC23805.1 DNA alkylation repair protein [Pseudomonadota bacterium]NDD03526.1 DNA alkylation repair protein [Pseudomonadota bacterium]NDG27550.1 DNA alkylation repair protein [Pseudomonadota bacterium]